MEKEQSPRPYSEWRENEHEKAEDAGHTFGYHLMKHCRDKAIASLPPNMAPEERQSAVDAVHLALHNVMDLLEGFWRLESGPTHTVKYQLSVVVLDQIDTKVENIDITTGIDLPIGFWGWAKDGIFR